MKNLNYIIGFSAFGFFLSFFTGLISTHKFPSSFVHALIFALIFGAIGYGLSLLFCNYLFQDNSYSDEGADTQEGQDSQAPRTVSTSRHQVDFTVSDEELPSEENESQFQVGSNFHLLTPQDQGAAAAEEPQEIQETQVSSSQGFSPVSLGAASVASGQAASAVKSEAPENNAQETILKANTASAGFSPVNLGKPVSSNDNVINSSEESSGSKVTQNTSSGDDSLDVLPDLENIGGHSFSSAVKEVEEEAPQTDDGFVPVSASPKPQVDADEIAKSSDVQVMAKAISTLLSKD